MRKKYRLIIVIIFVLFSKKMQVNALKIAQDTVITENISEGIEVIDNCKITFENDKDIHIGSINNTTSGISIKNGVTLTLDVSSKKNVNIYGGYYEEQDNKYDCAGIYVPVNSTLIINSTNEGSLIIYPFGMGSGIGGNGVFIENFDNNINCLDAGVVILEHGKVSIKNPLMMEEYGLGAKIGGGGICNVCDDVKCLFGGNLKEFKITGGELTIFSDIKDKQDGVGAIIGGGGISNYNEFIEKIYGGSAEKIYIYGGSININNDNSNLKNGAGAVIGGGGIYNTATVNNIVKGQLFLKECKNKVKITLSQDEPIYGDGNIYNNGLYIKAGSQVQNVSKNIDEIKESILKGVIDAGLICSGIFLIMELVS